MVTPQPHSITPWRRPRAWAGTMVALAEMERSQQFRGSSDEPSPIVNIEFHQTFAAHFQKEGLAGFLIDDIGAFHDLVDFERLLAEHTQDILPIIQHDYSLQLRNLT